MDRLTSQSAQPDPKAYVQRSYQRLRAPGQCGRRRGSLTETNLDLRLDQCRKRELQVSDHRQHLETNEESVRGMCELWGAS
jgi:hypothetical protein